MGLRNERYEGRFRAVADVAASESKESGKIYATFLTVVQIVQGSDYHLRLLLGNLDHGVYQCADAVDRDADHVAGFEAEIIRRHDPGAGQQDDPAGKWLSRPSQSIRSSKRRAIRAMLVSPSKNDRRRRARSPCGFRSSRGRASPRRA